MRSLFQKAFEDSQRYCVCACRIMQAYGVLPITPAKNGTHKRKRFPQNGFKVWRDPSARSHPCKLGPSGTPPNLPLSYTPKERGYILIKDKPLTHSCMTAAPASYTWYCVLKEVLKVKGPRVAQTWSVLRFSVFTFQLTTCRISNHTWLLPILLKVITIHTHRCTSHSIDRW